MKRYKGTVSIEREVKRKNEASIIIPGKYEVSVPGSAKVKETKSTNMRGSYQYFLPNYSD